MLFERRARCVRNYSSLSPPVRAVDLGVGICCATAGLLIYIQQVDYNRRLHLHGELRAWLVNVLPRCSADRASAFFRWTGGVLSE